MLGRTDNPSVVGIVRMVLSGVFDRIPELSLYFAESNASWIPSALFMVDDSYGVFKDWYGADLAMKPRSTRGSTAASASCATRSRSR